ncbi:MAG: DUF4230 domain-containing protein [Actinobacteria bacterium]|nr:DUF4230 domain-containing protein [Actinomycetota bacterium]
MFKQQRRRVSSVVTGGLVAVGLVTAAVVVGIQLLGNPFTTQEVDRSLPPVVVELKDLAEYHAAQGQFEVTLDQEQDVQWLPSALAGERVQYAALGTVDAVVDFTHLPDGAVQVTDDGNGVVITLPPAILMEPVLDTEHSHVMNRDRGLLNRIGGLFSDNPTSEHDLELAAESKLAAAAAATDLQQRAQDNTVAMLTAMFRTAGFDDVEVRFQQSTAGVA